MNREEFEGYLISIGGVYDWRGNNTTNPSFFNVNEGWFMIVKNLISELLEFGWDRHMIQSKEKFGRLNFYIKEPTKVLQGIILTYEKLSYNICEVCGQLGSQRNDGWVKTLCDIHADERENINQKQNKNGNRN